ncbi:MAG: SMC-Scp complex subunit ScpB [Leptolyngbya foveolarum]|uniref:SMC-Scp complex subunit ScpB n=1 Tax=Leptolyngbya foveolarum TaxID=47253 RepID=A0A2W4UEL4_9CYAN|nr:MAG: SMC-Scp complex subunit ScpB [Leptolyngbya foveolarum]
MSRLANTIEAILYLKAQPLKIAQIAELAKCDRDTAEEGLIELMGDYAHRDSAIEIAETEDGYALQLREIYKPLVDDIVPLDIGLGALRTLAAIALRGPIAQSELVDLRGSGVYQHVPDLVEQGFVKKRRQADGRSSWLQITEKFYQHFEIDKLPQISNLRLPKPIEKAATDIDIEIEDEGAEIENIIEAIADSTIAEVSVAVDSDPVDSESVDSDLGRLADEALDAIAQDIADEDFTKGVSPT